VQRRRLQQSNYADTLRIVANDAAFSFCRGRLGINKKRRKSQIS